MFLLFMVVCSASLLHFFLPSFPPPSQLPYFPPFFLSILPVFPLCHLLPLYHFFPRPFPSLVLSESVIISSLLPAVLHCCLFFFLSFLVSLLVIGGAALPLAGVVHARCADGAGDEVGGAGGHEVSHCRRDVHPLVCHQVICRAKTKTCIIQPNRSRVE